MPSIIDGKCTLREAIEAAETNSAVDGCAAGSGADKIVFDPAIIPLTGAGILLDDDLSNSSDKITESLTITGPGASLLTVDGDDSHQLFYLDSPGNDQTFRFSDMTLFQGYSDGSPTLTFDVHGAAIFLGAGETVYVADMRFEANTASNGGGAIYTPNTYSNAVCTVHVARSIFSGNRALGPTAGGAIRAGMSASISIEDSTFVDNKAQNTSGLGGAIFIFSNSTERSSSLDISRSTFSANKSSSSGGALKISGVGTSATISHSTIVGNQSNSDSSGIGLGGGIYVTGSLNLSNSIVAGNAYLRDPTGVSFANDIHFEGGGSIISNGFNFIGTNNHPLVTGDFPTGSPNINGDYVGGAAAQMIDPDLDPLGDYGGPTPSHRPKPGGTHMVIDKGSCVDEPHDQRLLGNNETKQRAVDRGDVANGAGSDGCDIGAVESGAEVIAPEDALCVPVRTANGNVALICL
jgi:predicted outer membrane repeat protein